jgi:hypothetical protein
MEVIIIQLKILSVKIIKILNLGVVIHIKILWLKVLVKNKY